MVGTSTRSAPISMPGTILSQLGMQSSASSWCASITVSTESAISSRDGSEYFMPPCPMAMPSSTPMVLNSKGTPPALRISSLAIRPYSCRKKWPGMMSMWLLAMPMKGLSKSSSLRPTARSRLRWGARSNPFLIVSERIVKVVTPPGAASQPPGPLAAVTRAVLGPHVARRPQVFHDGDAEGAGHEDGQRQHPRLERQQLLGRLARGPGSIWRKRRHHQRG